GSICPFASGTLRGFLSAKNDVLMSVAHPHQSASTILAVTPKPWEQILNSSYSSEDSLASGLDTISNTHRAKLLPAERVQETGIHSVESRDALQSRFATALLFIRERYLIALRGPGAGLPFFLRQIAQE